MTDPEWLQLLRAAATAAGSIAAVSLALSGKYEADTRRLEAAVLATLGPR